MLDIRCEATGKTTYPSLYHAQQRLALLRAKFGDGPDGIDTLEPYRCKHCRFWHIGRPGGERQRNRHQRRKLHHAYVL